MSGGPAPTPPALAARVWRKTCLHVNGLAIAGTVRALDRAGVLARLAGSAPPLSIAGLAAGHGLVQGYLHLALRLMASQGWVALHGPAGGATAQARLTSAGRAWLPVLPVYALAPAALDLAQALGPWLAGGPPPPAALTTPWRSPTGPAPTGPAAEAAAQVRGALVAAVMRHFSRLGVWEALAAGTAAPAALPARPDAARFCLGLLAQEDWAREEGGRFVLTDEGRLAMTYAPQYYAPLCYLPTFRAVPDRLAGRATAAGLAPAADGRECHLDRALDIEFSGLVFNRTCREPFLAAVLPLFDQPDPARQPTHVVDTGCGDATLLLELYRAVTTQTRRGAWLDRHPLVLVGAEFNPAARAIAQERLAAFGAPHLTLFGDIGDPEGLMAALAQRGAPANGVLHVSKSVLHNRVYRPPVGRDPLPAPHPTTHGVFLNREGGLIPPQDLARNLAETLAAWRPHAAAHGMVVIEAHGVDPALAAASRERQIVTSLDAYHGYSHQYLVEIELQRWAEEAAGLTAISRRDLGQAMTGRPLMSVDYLRPA